MNFDDPDSDPDPDRPLRRSLRVVVTDGRGRVRRADRLRRWLVEVAPASARGREVVVALVCDRKMRDLNRQYRGIDRATDVLSFPATDEVASDAGIAPAAPLTPDAGPDSAVDVAADAGGPIAPVAVPGAVGGGERHLGDVVIATGVASRQARTSGHRLGAELRCLALHGLLHLLGYDHERDRGEMERLEWRLRRQGGLA